MKRRLMVPVAVVALSAVAGTLWALGRDGHTTLDLSGTIEAQDVDVGSQIGGRVAAVHVAEGDVVRAGTPIVTLETNLLDPQIEEQRAKVEEARARLALLVDGSRREDKEQAKLEYENAERERVRYERLMAGGVIAQQQLDDAATRAALLREKLRVHENGSRTEDVAAARAAVARETGRLAYLEQQKNEAVVTAPAPGVVQTLDLRPGDLVAAGAPVARRIQPQEQWVRGYVPEVDLGWVRVGQRATVKVDTWPKRTFGGTVTEIRTRAEYTPRNVQTLSQREEQVFGVKVVLDPAPELKPGMAAIVTVARAAAPKGARS
jgi:multidrug resistance efflux pump